MNNVLENSLLIQENTACLTCRDELGMTFDTLTVTQMVTRRNG